MKRAFSFGDKSIESVVRRVNDVRKIAVIGAGTMGQGIVQDLLSKTSCDVVVLDVQPAALQRAKTKLERLWSKQVDTFRIRQEDARAFADRVVYTQDYAACADVDIVWEVATERSEIKAKIFEAIEKHTDPERLAAVFSNTSSHTTEELALLFKSEACREKFLTVHGYFPFEANRLIDVMKGKYASNETFLFGVVFADQILEKTVIALPIDHHGYITDPIFQAMAAIISWDVETSRDIVQLGGLWDLFTANPFSVLDQTGHMPYTESSRHLGDALPETDRLRSLYRREDKYYPDWIAKLETGACTGVNSSTRQGFYKWSDGHPPKAEAVLDPTTGEYVAIGEISRKDFWSYYEAAERDRRAGKIKSADSLVHVACAHDAGGRAFRRYVLPVMLYVMDMIQDRIATPGQINIATRAGLRFKVGLIELIDALIASLTIDGLIQLIRRSRDENAEDPYMVDMLDVDGVGGPEYRSVKTEWYSQREPSNVQAFIMYEERLKKDQLQKQGLQKQAAQTLEKSIRPDRDTTREITSPQPKKPEFSAFRDMKAQHAHDRARQEPEQKQQKQPKKRRFSAFRDMKEGRDRERDDR